MGAKLFTPNVGKNFGEAFLSTIDRERKLRQDQDQFNQAQAFRERQLDFLNVYRNSLTEQAKAQEERLQNQLDYNVSQGYAPVQEGLVPGRKNQRTGEFDTHLPTTTGKEVKGLFGADIGEGNFVRKDLIPQAPEEFTGDRYETISSNVKGTGKFQGQKVNKIYDKKEKREFQEPVILDPKSNESDNLTTPFISGDKLRNAKIKFQDIDKIYRELGGKQVSIGNIDPSTDASGQKNKDNGEITRQQLSVMRNQAFEDVVFQTNERSKNLNSIYENFDQEFQTYLSMAKKGDLTKDNLDRMVSDDMKKINAPKDMIKEMKELLKLRVF